MKRFCFSLQLQFNEKFFKNSLVEKNREKMKWFCLSLQLQFDEKDCKNSLVEKKNRENETVLH